MQLNRRQFLTGCGSFLASLGVLEGLQPLLDGQRGIAYGQSSPKKLALLIGVNQYQNRAHYPDLKGCVTDVELMRNLLIYRFGFNPQDILVLTNEAATRRAIELAFQAHLIDQAKGSDVVVFHFSGFGQYLLPQMPLKVSSKEPLTQYALLPYDAVMPADQAASEASQNAILQETLYLLIQSLKTERVVTILDTGFHYPETDNLDHARVRSLPPGQMSEVNAAEIALQDELLMRNKLKRSQLTERRLSTPPRGLVVTAASLQQFGVEADWQGFSSGALTYCLAQQLWHTAPNSSMAAQISRSAEFLAQEFSLTQQPELVGQKKSTLTRDVLGLPSGVPGDGVILETDNRGKSGEVWLGGMPPALLKTDKSRSIFAVMHKSPGVAEEKLVRVTGRRGLKGTVQSLGESQITAGDLLQERYRLLAKNQPLRLALSSKLEKVEKIDATSVFGGNGSSVKVVKNDQSADIVLSKLERVTQASLNDGGEQTQDSADPQSPQTYYCLSSLAGDILPGTVSDRPEAVKNRYDAFQATFDVLRWHQCLEQLINTSNSDVSASVALGTTSESGTKNIWLAKSTTAAAKGPNTVPIDTAPGRILTLNSDSKFQLILTNSSPDNLFAYLFGFDAQPNAIMVYRVMTPPEDGGEKPMFQPFRVEMGNEMVLPTDAEEFGVYGPSGIGSLYVLLTRSPLTLTDQAIEQATKKSANKSSQPKQIKIAEPLELRDALLSDLATISQVDSQVADFVDQKNWMLSVKDWAMMRFVYQIL